MDLGTMISKLVNAEYRSVEQVRAAVRLIASNCERYWKGIYGNSLAPDLVKYTLHTAPRYTLLHLPCAISISQAQLIKDAACIRDTFFASLDKHLSKRQSAESTLAPILQPIPTPTPTKPFSIPIIEPAVESRSEPKGVESGTSSSKVLKKEKDKDKKLEHTASVIPKKPSVANTSGQGKEKAEGRMNGSVPSTSKDTIAPTKSSAPTVHPQPVVQPADLPTPTSSQKVKPSARLREGFLSVLQKLQEHYVMGPWSNKVFTAEPFTKAVDTVKFSDYTEVGGPVGTGQGQGAL